MTELFNFPFTLHSLGSSCESLCVDQLLRSVHPCVSGSSSAKVQPYSRIQVSRVTSVKASVLAQNEVNVVRHVFQCSRWILRNLAVVSSLKKFIWHQRETRQKLELCFEEKRMGKLEEPVVNALKESKQPLTLAEIAEKIGQPEKKVFRELRSLFEKEMIDTENRHYRLVEKK